MTVADSTTDYFALGDWRRRVADLYAETRARLGRDAPGAHAAWRRGRDDLFRRHPQSPLAADARLAFNGLTYFRYDPRYAFSAAVRPLPERHFDLQTSNGTVVRFVRFGAVDLPIGQLQVFWLDAYGGGVFLPFRDATAPNTTYGGGRYLLDTAKGADLGVRGDALLLDFNFAYHPSCAYDSSWSCPLAPVENRLSSAVEAGERLNGAAGRCG
jgi:uncharacterized protein (DUF1684 family)